MWRRNTTPGVRRPSPAFLVACCALGVALASPVHAQVGSAVEQAGDLTVRAAAAIANGSVTPAKIRKGAVTKPKIRKGAVTKGKIAKGAVGSGKIAPRAVGAGKIKDGAIQPRHLSAAATPRPPAAHTATNAAGAVLPFNSPVPIVQVQVPAGRYAVQGKATLVRPVATDGICMLGGTGAGTFDATRVTGPGAREAIPVQGVVDLPDGGTIVMICQSLTNVAGVSANQGSLTAVEVGP